MTPSILIVGEACSRPKGIELLRTAAKLAFPQANPTVLLPAEEALGLDLSFAQDPLSNEAEFEAIGEHTYQARITTYDLVRRGITERERFTKRDFDLVLCGVRPKPSLGFDVFTSGTTAAAMTAATAFGLTSVAFSGFNHTTQDALAKGFLPVLERVLPDFLRKLSLDGGTAWNVNVPAGPFLGYTTVKLAHYSYENTPSTKIIPRSRDEKSDVTVFLNGGTTVSELNLRADPTHRY